MGVTVAPHKGDAVTRALVDAVTSTFADLPSDSDNDIAVWVRESGIPSDSAAASASAVTVIDTDEIDGARLAGVGHAGAVVTVGTVLSADLVASDIRTTLDGTSFLLAVDGSRHAVMLGLLGERYVIPALAAIAVGRVLGRTIAASIAAVETVTAPEGEMNGDLSSGIVVIDDSADAGSRSTVEALKTLAETAGDTRRSIAVLGELAGAGSDARDEHDRIGRIVVRLNISQLVVVGAGARHLAAAAGLEGSWDGESVLVGTAGEAYDLVRAIIREGDVVLVKVPGLAARLVTATSGVLR